MKSLKLGKSISKIEVQDILKHGIWLYVQDKEYFLPYENYPWFRNERVSDIYNVRLIHTNHLYWPNLDIDIELESLKNLEQYPLVYKK